MVDLKFLLIVAEAIHPGASKTNNAHEVLSAIVGVVNSSQPPTGWTQEKFASVLVVTGWRESRFNMQAVGDKGVSRCAMQVRNGPTHDPIRCVSMAAHTLRLSVSMCPSSPLAMYVGGCAVPAARKEGDLRMSIAASAKARADQTLRMPTPRPKVPRRPNVQTTLKFPVFVDETDFPASSSTVLSPRELTLCSSQDHLLSGHYSPVCLSR